MATLERPLGTFVSTPSYAATLRRVLGRVPVIPLAIIFLIVFVAIFANILAPYDPTVPVPGGRIFRPPAWMTGGNWATPLGTDFQGRDVLSRLLHGARVSVIVAMSGTVAAGGLGLLLGVLAGYIGGWVDQVIMRVADAWLALPSLVFAIFLAALLGPGVGNIVFVFAVIYWTRYARVIRGEVLSLRERDFVRLAQVAGASKTRIILKHIIPNILNTWMVMASLTVGVVIIFEASLSFLGLGVPPPQPAWGLMLSEARTTLLAGQWWLTVFPGVCISLVVLAVNLAGDWLRIKLDPHQRNL